MTVKAMWAQALDNTSPDEIEVPGDDMTREDAVAHVYRVIEAGKRIHASKNVKLISHRDQSVLEVISNVHDQAGRFAPIVCYIRHETNLTNNSASELAAVVAQFGAKIGRDLPEGYDAEIAQAINALKKKQPNQTHQEVGNGDARGSGPGGAGLRDLLGKAVRFILE